MEVLIAVAVKVGVFLLIYALGEFIAHFLIFRILNTHYMPQKASPVRPSVNGPVPVSRAQEKGHYERALLFIGLAAGYPQVLIAFGALKVGTFFKDKDENEKVSNAYYLIGNAVSISMAMLYAVMWELTIGLLF